MPKVVWMVQHEGIVVEMPKGGEFSAWYQNPGTCSASSIAETGDQTGLALWRVHSDRGGAQIGAGYETGVYLRPSRDSEGFNAAMRDKAKMGDSGFEFGCQLSVCCTCLHFIKIISTGKA